MSREEPVTWEELFTRAATYEVDRERIEDAVRAIRDGE